MLRALAAALGVAAAAGAKIAFFGDSGIGNDDPGDAWVDYLGVQHDPVYLVDGVECRNYAGEPCRLKSFANRVLARAREEGAELVVHTGDMDYESAPVAWSHFLDEHLRGMDFLAAMGNHDQDGWDGVEYLWSGSRGYKALLSESVPARASCYGEYGEDYACEYDGTLVVLSSIGVRASGEGANRDKAAFVRAALEKSDAPWKVCVWHMTMKDMQVSYKGDATGWEVYEACRANGAFIVISHAHIYSRSYEIGRFATEKWGNHKEDIVVSSWDGSTIRLRPNHTAVAVVGTGGFKNERMMHWRDHWATVYSTTCMEEATTCKRARYPDIFGVLVCDFKPLSTSAECRFVTSENGIVIDRFTLQREAEVGAAAGPPQSAPLPVSAELPKAKMNSYATATRSAASAPAPSPN